MVTNDLGPDYKKNLCKSNNLIQKGKRPKQALEQQQQQNVY